MLRSFARYVSRHHVALLALFLAMGGTSYALSGGFAGSGGVLRACAGKRTGALRVIKPGQRCRRGEQLLSWNQIGLPGAAGKDGVNGAAGSNATITGVAAGGDLAGAYPNPSIQSGAVTPAKIGGVPTVALTNSTEEPSGSTMTFDTERFDPLDMHSATVNPSRITAPIAGAYLVDANVCFAASAAGDRDLEIKQNGTTVSLLQQPNDGAARASCIHDSVQLKLNAGEYLELLPFTNEGSPKIAVGFGEPAFAATWIAPA